MRADEFELLLGLLSRLSVEQKDRLRVSLAAGDQEAAVVELLESRLGADRCCVHCARNGSCTGGLAMVCSDFAAEIAVAVSMP